MTLKAFDVRWCPLWYVRSLPKRARDTTSISHTWRTVFGALCYTFRAQIWRVWIKIPVGRKTVDRVIADDREKYLAKMWRGRQTVAAECTKRERWQKLDVG